MSWRHGTYTTPLHNGASGGDLYLGIPSSVNKIIKYIFFQTEIDTIFGTLTSEKKMCY